MPEGGGGGATSGYSLEQARRVLAEVRLLDGLLLRHDDRWRRQPATMPLTAPCGFAGATLDSRSVQPGQLFVALAGEHVDGRSFVTAALRDGAAAALTRTWSDGDDPLCAESAAGCDGVVLLSGDPEAALALLGATWRREQESLRVAAVTGSNGKTTTKDLLAGMLRRTGSTCATRGNLNNQLGLPLTLLGIEPGHRFAVIEMGASRQGDIAALADLARPDVGVITNAAEAHLAEFGSLAGVILGKGELLEALPMDGLAVLNADSPGYEDWCRRARCRISSFGRRQGHHHWSWRPHSGSMGGELDLDGQTWQVPLPGEHNGENLAAAILAARHFGVTDAEISASLPEFSPSAHRSCWRRLGPVQLLDDSYNANPRSVLSATAALRDLPGDGRNIAVLGLMAELGPDSEKIHRSTGEQLFARGLDILLAVGAGTEPLAEGFMAASGRAVHVRDKQSAYVWLTERCRAGDRILVKGSRVAAMEDVVAMLQRHLTAAESTEQD